MRNLLITVGAPGSGKSTWLKENDLERYTIAPDTLRLLISAPEYKTDGSTGISQSNDSQAWSLLDELLEQRMKAGHFTVVDATHTREKYLKRYKKLADKYRYRLYFKRFDVPLEELIERNKKRDVYKRVPVDAIEMHAERMKSLKIPGGCQEIQELSEINEFVRYTPFDLEPIYFIGDIHGTIEPLQKFLDEHFTTEKGMFVFVGDYIDRGVSNGETLKRLFELSKARNTIFLEGNHERWLWHWANDELDQIRSREFMLNTMAQLKDVDKKEARQFYRQLRTFASFSQDGKLIFACHGGVSTAFPNFISTEQLINGVGKYEALPEVYDAWRKREKDEVLVHGHRNVQQYPIQVEENIYNLDGSVEMGGALRVVRFNPNGTVDTFEYANEHYQPRALQAQSSPDAIDNTLAVESFKRSKYVRAKSLGDPTDAANFGRIVSFNFTDRAFFDKKWNNETIRARGLFVDTDTNTVVARSYDKFFNLNEVPDTREENLPRHVQLPVTAWAKYNGFLGIVGYDKKTDTVMYCSKSTDRGIFAEMFREILLKYTTEEKLKEVVSAGKSLVFECVDPVRDPHIVKYESEPFVVLLDCIDNSFRYNKEDYETLMKISEQLRVPVKEKLATIESFVELAEYTKSMTALTRNEGTVMEDARGFMWKLKGDYYRKWKTLRSAKDRASRQDFRATDWGFDAESIAFLEWCKTKPEDYIRQTDIITLRDEFHGSGGGENAIMKPL